MQKVKIIVDDCLSALRNLPEKTFSTCVTSPPYFGLRDYGVEGQLGLEETPEEFVENLVGVFEEVRRVLRDDGTLWLNIGDSYAGSGRGRNGDGTSAATGKQATNRGSAEGVLIKTRTPSCKPKDLIGIPWMLAFALRNAGWYLRQDIIWAKPNPMPEPVKDRCVKAHEYIFLFSKSPKYFFDHTAMLEDSTGISGGGFSKKYAENQLCHGAMRLDRPKNTGKRTKRSVWNVVPKSFKGAHFATFPTELITPCVLAGSPIGGKVLDPFGGSGTTGLVAARNGRDAVLIELNPAYAKMASDRLKDEAEVEIEI